MNGQAIVAAVMVSTALAAGDLLRNGNLAEPLNADGSIPHWDANNALAAQDIQVVRMDDMSCLQILTLTSTKSAGVLSQAVPIQANSRYSLTLWAKRDSFVYGTSFEIALLRNGTAINRQQKMFRSSRWAPLNMVFETGDADTAVVRIVAPNTGSWRITRGRRLWVRDLSLVQLTDAGICRIAASGGAMVQTDVLLPETTVYYLWVRTQLREQDAFELTIGSQQRSFRGYTTGRQYWLRPVLPDLVLPAGRISFSLKAERPGTAIREAILTPDPFFEPDGADELLDPVAENSRQTVSERAPRSSGTLDLRVDQPLPADGWGLTQGIPFPRGALRDPGRIEAADGTRIQADSMAHWPDGSVKWLRLSAVMTQQRNLQLRYGAGTTGRRDGRPVAVQAENRILLDTGAAELAVAQESDSLLTVTWEGVSHELRLRHKGKSVTMPAQATLVENGPVRAVVRLHGELERGLAYTLWLTAYARLPDVQAEICVANTGEAPVETDAIEVALSGAFTEASWHVAGVDQEPFRGALTEVPIELRGGVRSPGGAQNDFPFSLGQGDAVLLEGCEAVGAVTCHGGSTASIAVADFWRNAPQHMVVDRSTVALRLFGSGITLPAGVARTQRVILTPIPLAARLPLFLQPPLLLAPLAWTCDSKALHAHPWPGGSDEDALYERSVELSLATWIEREKTDLRRDWYQNTLFAGEVRYGKGGGNLETALGEGTMVQFLRTGRRDWFDAAARWIGHFADVDISHATGPMGGRVWVHGPVARKPVSSANGHSWFGGTVLYGLFTGSHRILALADSVGRHHAQQITPFPKATYVHYWRRPAWQLAAILEAYGITGDPALLPRARELVELTRAQRDHVITLWPYMFSVGLRGLRMYNEATGDPVVRELYLQLMDAYMFLRQRPHDTSFGEHQKAPGMLLGNYPNDRSCCFYNETAHADWLAGEIRHTRSAAADLIIQLQYGVADPTFLWGSADLLRAMHQADILLPTYGTTAHTPEVLIVPPDSASPLRDANAPVMVFQVREPKDQAFTVRLQTRPFRNNKYVCHYSGQALLYSPSGRLVTRTAVRTDGLRAQTITVPLDAETGVYTLAVVLRDPWDWTLEEIVFDLTAGGHSLAILPRYDRMLLDAFCLVPEGTYNPATGFPPPASALLLQAERLAPDVAGFEVLGDRHAQGAACIVRTSAKEPARYEVTVPEAGRYAFHARVFKGAPDLFTVAMDGGEPVNCSQVHDMTGNAYPSWKLGCSLEPEAIVTTWTSGTTIARSVAAFDSSKLIPTPALKRIAVDSAQDPPETSGR